MLTRKLGVLSVWMIINRLTQFFELILALISSIKIASSNGWELRQHAQFVAGASKVRKVIRMSLEITTATMGTPAETPAPAMDLSPDEVAGVGV